MSWYGPQPKIYIPPSRFESSRARRAERGSDDHRDYSMDEYREFVTRIADGEWPSETILNRSSDHAAVILENLFRKAIDSVEILTSELKADVYGMPGVVNSALGYLQRNDDARIYILAESTLDRAVHPFLKVIDDSGLGDRVSIKLVDPTAKANYKFNFAVADGRSFRFEESRESLEAIVGFGHDRFANRLHVIFSALSASST